MNNNVVLRVNGREWGGWTSARISAGIERMARDFNVQITRRWPGDRNINSLRPGIKKGDRVEVLIGSDLVITGHVEATPVRYDSTQIDFSIVGRSLTGDLIDCAAATQQFSARSIVQIAAALAAPFSITVLNKGAPLSPLSGVQAEHGETVHEVINKMLGLQQALAYDNPAGELVIGAAGSSKAHTALVLGENILSCDSEQSIRERFSDYRVSGQRAGDDLDFGEATISAIKAAYTDPEITRYRPYITQQTGNATTATCKARCEFEARQRAAKTDETTYTVQGWRQGDGSLWQPNQRVIVFDPVLGFNNRELLIAEVTYMQSGAGTTAELRVGPVDAYLPEPADPKKKKAPKENPFL